MELCAWILPGKDCGLGSEAFLGWLIGFLCQVETETTSAIGQCNWLSSLPRKAAGWAQWLVQPICTAGYVPWPVRALALLWKWVELLAGVSAQVLPPKEILLTEIPVLVAASSFLSPPLADPQWAHLDSELIPPVIPKAS